MMVPVSYRQTPLMSFSYTAQPAKLQTAIVLRAMQTLYWQKLSESSRNRASKRVTTNKQIAAQYGIQIEEPHVSGDEGEALNICDFVFLLKRIRVSVCVTEMTLSRQTHLFLCLSYVC